MKFPKIIILLIISLSFNISICLADTSSTPAGAIVPVQQENKGEERLLIPQSCAAPDSLIEVVKAWARPSITSKNIGNNNSAVYFKLHNNSDIDYNLINVNSGVASRVELHKSFVDEKGISKMIKLDKLVIPAKGEIILKPGDLHIMLLDLKNTLKVGDKFDLLLYFDNGVQKVVKVEVKTA